MDILSEIIAKKRLHLEMAKRNLPLDEIRLKGRDARVGAKRHAFRDALGSNDSTNIIAEFKRCSPSKGLIREDADVSAMTRSYESAGAAAISVLTEENYFHGSLDDLREARRAASLPILRKDFIFDDYQVYESASAGADALLLIVAALDDASLARLRQLTEDELGMDALVEIHTKEELDRAVSIGAKLIGVNNRDLRTFNVSTETSAHLAPFAPANAVLVSESGLSPDDIRDLQALGFRGFLVGESLMGAADPAHEIQLLRYRSAI